MEETIMLTREEFMELIKNKVRVEVVADIIAKNNYVSTDEICAVLGIEVKNG